MKDIYFKKNNNIELFLDILTDETDFVVIDDDFNYISESAFANSSVTDVLFKGSSSGICKMAFENCNSLKTVIFGELGRNDKIECCDVKNLRLGQANIDYNMDYNGDYIIQHNAFSDCSNLTTLILPKITGTLDIENDAFSGCKSLRAVVAICDKISGINNIPAGCSNRIDLVCKKSALGPNFNHPNVRPFFVD